MDTELYKMSLTIISQIIDKLPVAATTIIIIVLGGFALHKSKRIPYKIVRQGTNGHTLITADMLKANCDEFHIPLNRTLETQSETLKTLVGNQVKISDRVGEIAETVSFIRGQLSK